MIHSLRKTASILLALIMVMGMLPNAFAESDAPAPVSGIVIRIEADDALILDETEIDLDTYFAIDGCDPQRGFTALHAIKQALNDSGINITINNGAYGPEIITIGTKTKGSASGWTYTVNNDSPASGAGAHTLQDGDSVVLSYIASWDTHSSYFDKTAANVAQGSALELTLTENTFDDNWNSVRMPVEGAEIYVDGAATDAVTDADGKVTVTLADAGEHYITAYKMSGGVSLITRPYCKVNVTESSGSAVNDIYIRVEGYDATILPKTKISSLTAFDMTGLGLTASPEKVTALHALVKGLKDKGLDIQEKSVLDLSSSGYMKSVCGTANSTDGYDSWMYAVNDIMPESTGISEYELKDGDCVTVYYASWMYAYYSWFDKQEVSVSAAAPVSLTLSGENIMYAMFGMPKGTEPISGAELYVSAADGTAADTPTGIITDDDGKAEISFEAPGVYIVSAVRFSELDDEIIDLTRAYCKVTVSSGAVIKTELVSKISEAEAIDQSKYTAETASALSAALSAAKTVSGNADATQAQVNEAAANLGAAIQGLALKTVSKTELASKISQAEAIDQSKYTVATVSAFISALSAAKTVNGSADATQAQVDKAAADLGAAISGLRLKSATDATVQEVLAYLSSLDAYKTTTDPWIAMDMAAYGKSGSLTNISAIIAESKVNFAKSDVIATDLEQYIIGLTALGIDASKLDGMNGIERIANYKKTDATPSLGTLNAFIYALIAYDSGEYTLPDNAYWTRDRIINHIIDTATHNDGGWALEASKSLPSDPDVTAMAIAALTPYYGTPKVKTAVDTAIATLSQMYQANGAFKSRGVANSNSASHVIIALCALNINPNTDPRFVKNNVGVVDHLLTFKLASPDNRFGNSTNTTYNSMSTDHAFRALISFSTLSSSGNAYSVYKFGRISGGGSADKTALKAKIAVAEAIDKSKYTAETAANLTNSINAAKAADSNASATQAQVNTATANLTTAINELLLKTSQADKSALTAKITLAEAINTALYTASTVNTFTNALSAAKAVSSNASAIQSQVDAALQSLTAAITGLVLKGGSSGGGGGGGDNTITATIKVQGDSKKGIIVNSVQVTLTEGSTVFDLLKKVLDERSIPFDYSSSSFYVKSIDGLAEFSNGSYSGWLYRVNSVKTTVSSAEVKLKNGDNVLWFYTDDYTNEPDIVVTVPDTKVPTSGGGGGTQSQPSGSVEAETTTTVNAAGIAVTTVTESALNKAVGNAVALGGEGKSYTVVLKSDVPENAKGMEIGIPNKAFMSLVNDTENWLKIDAGAMGSLTFDHVALGAIAGAGGGDIVISSRKVDAAALTKEQKDIVGSSPVYEFSVMAGAVKVSDFGGGSCTVSVPFTPAEGEVTGAYVVYFINDKAELELVRGSYNEKTGCIDFVLKHFSKYFVKYNLVTYNDVKKTDWFYNPVAFIAARGIPESTESYEPSRDITRAEFLVMLLRAYDVDVSGDLDDNFDDTASGAFAPYIAVAKKMGITNGVGGNKFAPDMKITRETMFTMVYRAMTSLYEPLAYDPKLSLEDFADVDDLAPYTVEAVEALVAGGIITGINKMLAPKSNVTRADVAKVIYELVK